MLKKNGIAPLKHFRRYEPHTDQDIDKVFSFRDEDKYTHPNLQRIVLSKNDIEDIKLITRQAESNIFEEQTPVSNAPRLSELARVAAELSGDAEFKKAIYDEDICKATSIASMYFLIERRLDEVRGIFPDSSMSKKEKIAYIKIELERGEKLWERVAEFPAEQARLWLEFEIADSMSRRYEVFEELRTNIIDRRVEEIKSKGLAEDGVAEDILRIHAESDIVIAFRIIEKYHTENTGHDLLVNRFARKRESNNRLEFDLALEVVNELRTDEIDLDCFKQRIVPKELDYVPACLFDDYVESDSIIINAEIDARCEDGEIDEQRNITRKGRIKRAIARHVSHLVINEEEQPPIEYGEAVDEIRNLQLMINDPTTAILDAIVKKATEIVESGVGHISFDDTVNDELENRFLGELTDVQAQTRSIARLLYTAVIFEDDITERIAELNEPAKQEYMRGISMIKVLNATVNKGLESVDDKIIKTAEEIVAGIEYVVDIRYIKINGNENVTCKLAALYELFRDSTIEHTQLKLHLEQMSGISERQPQKTAVGVVAQYIVEGDIKKRRLGRLQSLVGPIKIEFNRILSNYEKEIVAHVLRKSECEEADIERFMAMDPGVRDWRMKGALISTWSNKTWRTDLVVGEKAIAAIYEKLEIVRPTVDEKKAILDNQENLTDYQKEMIATALDLDEGEELADVDIMRFNGLLANHPDRVREVWKITTTNMLTMADAAHKLRNERYQDITSVEERRWILSCLQGGQDDLNDDEIDKAWANIEEKQLKELNSAISVPIDQRRKEYREVITKLYQYANEHEITDIDEIRELARNKAEFELLLEFLGRPAANMHGVLRTDNTATKPKPGRTKNQDNLTSARISQDRQFGAVYDGAGGHKDGAKASMIAKEIMDIAVVSGWITDAESIRKILILSHMVILLNEINDRPQQQSRKGGMMTTAAIAICKEDKVTTIHTGDSRVFVIDPIGRKVTYLTKEHTLGQDMLNLARSDVVDEWKRSGKQINVTTQNEFDMEIKARANRMRINMYGLQPAELISSSLGVDLEHLDINDSEKGGLSATVEPGHIVVVASDGITKTLQNADYLQAVDDSGSDMNALAKKLVEMAEGFAIHQDDKTAVCIEIA